MNEAATEGRFGLVNSTGDKVLAMGKGLVAEIVALALAWYLLGDTKNPLSPQMWFPVLTVCILGVLIPGPLILIDALTMHICITDRGVSTASMVNRHREPWILWEQITRIDVKDSPSRDSGTGVSKVVIHGRREMHGLGGTYWQPRRVVIPGYLPEIQHILQILREIAPEKFSS